MPALYLAPLLLLLLFGGGAAINAFNQPAPNNAVSTAASVPEPEAMPIVLSVGAIAGITVAKKFKKA